LPPRSQGLPRRTRGHFWSCPASRASASAAGRVRQGARALAAGVSALAHPALSVVGLPLSRGSLMNRSAFRSLTVCVLLLAAAPLAHAQFAVIDVASLTQLVTEVQTLEQQLATARSELTQA